MIECCNVFAVQELTCREYEERYEVKMNFLIDIKRMTNDTDDEMTLGREFLPVDSLARNTLRVSISSLSEGYSSSSVTRYLV